MLFIQELIIMVTPRLAKPIRPGGIKLPTDSFIEPSDAEFYWLGRIEGKNKNRESATEEPQIGDDEGGIEGEYGQQIN